jgi:sugar phosphate isomerase/epimerase
MKRHTHVSRRDFVKSSFRTGLAVSGMALLGASARAIEPFQRPGKPRLLLSLAAYSFRDSFNHKDPAQRISLFDFIDYCADHHCKGTELTSYYFPKDLDADYLLKVKRHAFLRGIAISGTAVGNNFALPEGPKRDEQIAMVKRWADHCAVMGAPHIRVFAGPAGTLPPADARKLCIAALEECAEYSGRKGVFLGLENHGGIVAEAEDLLDIVRAVKSPWFGVNLDSGNFHTEDPYADLAKCAPYAVNAQVKVEMRRRGEKKEPADVARIVKILRDANYQGYVALEYEAAEDPWKAIPRHLDALRKALQA